jgi:alkanesulfonate monooxygenase SsuD/methylene tetrahydromethanopterin reductase-like flavin-dependent oxidoreductase (luciferase family)
VPRPTRPIPIWLGGSGEAAFERAARLADGFIFSGGREEGIAPAVDAWKRLRARLDGLGRSADEFGAECVVRPGAGLPALADAWREAGGSHLSVVTMNQGLDGVEAHIDVLASVAQALNL